MPGHLYEACDEDQECISSYRMFGFTICFISAIVSAYFNNILNEYKERLIVEYDEIRIDEIIDRFKD